MIRKLSIRNFESHEDSEIEFTPGLNLIIGQSNQGKSSIVRALALVAANRFDKDCVRTGCDFCTVRAETDRGWVECRRGESVNEWVVAIGGNPPQAYRNIGAGMPPGALEALGIGERPRGDMREIPNIMFQLEKHYMLAEIDGKKATANVVARMMDDAIGLGGMEELIKDIATDYAGGRKRLGTLTEEVSAAEAAVLPAEVFNAHTARLDSLREKMAQAEADAALLATGADYAARLRQISRALAAARLRAGIGAGLEERLARLGEMAGKLALLHRARIASARLASAEGRAAIGRGLEERLAVLEEKGRRLALLRQAAEDRGALERAAILAATAGFEERLQRLEARRRDIAAARKRLEDARAIYRNLMAAKKTAGAAGAALAEADKTFHSYRDALGVCPLCGAALGAEKGE